MTSPVEALQVEIARDGMSASILPLASEPPPGMKARHVREALAARGVCFGIDENAIAELLAAWQEGRAKEPAVVARGVAPVPANAGGLVRLDPPSRSGRNPVELLPLYVRMGERIFAVEPPRGSRDGTDVLGRPCVSNLEESPVNLRPGPGITVEGAVWTAAVPGFLCQSDGSIRVVGIMMHRHDLPAGDYHWSGDVEVYGALRDGTRIRASGSILAAGGIDGDVVLEAGGSVVIQGAVRGGGKMRVEALGSVTADELEGGAVLAGGDVLVAGACVDTCIRTRGRFIGEGVGSRITGGRVEAVTGAVIGGEVGDARGTPTRVTVGLANWVLEQANSLDTEIRRWVVHNATVVESFERRHQSLLAHRPRIYRLPEEARRRFEAEREQLAGEQSYVDARIVELRRLKEMLLAAPTQERGAVIRIGRAHRGASFAIGGQTHEVRAGTLESVVLTISPKSKRILPVPQGVYDSSAFAPPAETSPAPSR